MKARDYLKLANEWSGLLNLAAVLAQALAIAMLAWSIRSTGQRIQDGLSEGLQKSIPRVERLFPE